MVAGVLPERLLGNAYSVWGCCGSGDVVGRKLPESRLPTALAPGSSETLRTPIRALEPAGEMAPLRLATSWSWMLCPRL
jgi:hypothetical protein